MIQFYMDTNVFISRLKIDDPYNSEAKTIERWLGKGEILAETSVLTLLETASAASRFYSAKYTRTNEKARKIFVVRTLERLVKLKVKFINIPGDTQISIKGIDFVLPSLFNEAILLSLSTGSLKTLDLQHLAAARYARRMNTELVALVTGDREFLQNKIELAGIVGMGILSPSEFVERHPSDINRIWNLGHSRASNGSS